LAIAAMLTLATIGKPEEQYFCVIEVTQQQRIVFSGGPCPDSLLEWRRKIQSAMDFLEIALVESRLAEPRAQFGNSEEEKGPPLEAVSRGLVKT
jgi:hypothetical protein